MKRNQINKTVLVVTIFITVLFSCKKEQRFLPNSDNAQSAENVSVPATSIEGLHIFYRTPILFLPFEMVDQNGVPIQPDKVLTTKSGNKITAKVYFDSLNHIERKLNEIGYTLRNNQPVVVSQSFPDNADLDKQAANEPEPIEDLPSDEELDQRMEHYMSKEIKTVRGIFFENNGDSPITIPASERSPFALPSTIAGISIPLTQNELNKKKVWEFGTPKTIKGSVDVELTCKPDVYGFDSLTGNTKTAVNVTAKSKIGAIIFGRNIPLFNAVAGFNASASPNKNMNAKVTVTAAGFTILNLSKSYSKRTSIIGDKSRSLNKSVSINVPIFWGLSFTGKIGVIGKAGLKYSATLDQGYVSAQVTPYSKISGYVEAGVSFLNIVNGGVGSELVFVNGKIPLRGSMYVALANPNQIVLRSAWYFGYDLVMLKGRLFCYGEVCIPWVYCYRAIEHNFFSWKGYTKKGTLYQGSKDYVIQNQ